MIFIHMFACVLGFWIDRMIGDPPHWPHPVRWIGSFIHFFTKHLNQGRFRLFKGAVVVVIIVGSTVAIVRILIGFVYEIHLVAGVLFESLLIAVGLAQKSLKDAAMEVYHPLQAGDLSTARLKCSWIVGRDTAKLDERELTRATVETISENSADGVTAPLFWALLLGAPGLWGYKAINTLDSMIGYRNDRFEQFGKCAARLDDIVNYVPARLTGLCILLGTKNEGSLPLRIRLRGWWHDARKHPSPNSGYLEAATAWQLGVTLGGRNEYHGVPSERPKVGPSTAVLLQRAHIIQTIQQLYRVSVLFLCLCIVLGGIIYVFTA